MAINANRIFSIQTAKPGVSEPPTANMVENRIKRMYEKLQAKPTPICNPMPPLTFRDERDTPIRVNINVEKG